MWTKKIEIKDENHLEEVVKALKSNGERIWGKYYEYPSIKSFWYDDIDNCWYYAGTSIDNFETDKDVPEFEMITKTSYELKEVPKIKITCKNCGKTIEYNRFNDMFKDFVGFSGYIDNGDKAIESKTITNICKDCIKKLLNNE